MYKLIPVYLLQKLVLAKQLSSSNHNQVPMYQLLNSKNRKYSTVNTMRQRILFSQSKPTLVQANWTIVKQLNYLHYIFMETRWHGGDHTVFQVVVLRRYLI
jgi:hypothetical protein